MKTPRLALASFLLLPLAGWSEAETKPVPETPAPVSAVSEPVADQANSSVAESESAVVLDPVEVTAPREDAVSRTLRAQDRQAAGELAESERHRTGELSRTINSRELPLVGAGLTADKLAADAEHRAAVLEQERVLLISLRDAKTDEERRELKADLSALRDLRRVQTDE